MTFNKTQLIFIIPIAVATGVMMGLLQLYFLIAVPIILLLSHYLIVVLLIKKYQKNYDSDLSIKCNPKTYIKFARLSRYFVGKKAKTPMFLSTMAITEAVGLRNLGKIEQAYNILKRVDVHSLSDYPESIIQFHNNMADLLILKCEYESAQREVDAGRVLLKELNDPVVIEKYIKATGIKKVDILLTITNWGKSLGSNQATIDFHIGKLDGVEEFFLKRLYEAKNNYSKMEQLFNLARFYFTIKQFDKAQIHLNNIIANGGKLFHVVQAQKLKALI
ncbi:MAG: hypothetical protein FWD86_01570 [Firmicutes bacterium]|nr:hypothetical protein [Bacillota bacterium]